MKSHLYLYTIPHKHTSYVATGLDTDGTILFTATYILLGKYSTASNVWVWCDANIISAPKSNVVDKTFVAKTTTIRNNIMINNHANDITTQIKCDVSVIPTSGIFDLFSKMENLLNKRIVIDDSDNDFWTVIMLDIMLVDNA